MTTRFSIDALLGNCEPSGSQRENESSISLRLEGGQLWEQFHSLGTEMIVTKSGRRMFPTLQMTVTGLQLHSLYSFIVDLKCVDQKRYRYSFHQSKWIATGPGEPELPSRVFLHPDSPAPGRHWMKGPISFDKIKLTNNQMDTRGHIIVNSMHKYQPQISILKHNSVEKRETFSFPETTFIAVTAYQNHRITSLKIERNPFAKGFREGDVDDEMRGHLNLFKPFFSSISSHFQYS